MQCLLRMMKSADSANLQDKMNRSTSRRRRLLQDESGSADLNFFQDVQHLEKV